MLLLSIPNCNPPGENKNNIHAAYESGMILLVVLWMMMIVSLPMIYLFSSILIDTKLNKGLLEQIQQFEATEAALLQGEKKASTGNITQG